MMKRRSLIGGTGGNEGAEQINRLNLLYRGLVSYNPLAKKYYSSHLSRINQYEKKGRKLKPHRKKKKKVKVKSMNFPK